MIRSMERHIAVATFDSHSHAVDFSSPFPRLVYRNLITTIQPPYRPGHVRNLLRLVSYEGDGVTKYNIVRAVSVVGVLNVRGHDTGG